MNSAPQSIFASILVRGAVLLAVVIAAAPLVAVAGTGQTGEQIYRRQCASCHGSMGEGTDEHYPRPLIGERSVDALSRLIAKTMPEDAPGECVGEDADRVAAFIYDAFYSENGSGPQQVSASAHRAVAADRSAI